MRKQLYPFLILFIAYSLSAQNAADIDNSFNTEGWFGLSGTVTKIAHRADGKILVGGIVSFYKGTSVNNIFSLNSDGSLDNTFNPGTTFSASVNTFAIQSDGKIIVAGNTGSKNTVNA